MQRRLLLIALAVLAAGLAAWLLWPKEPRAPSQIGAVSRLPGEPSEEPAGLEGEKPARLKGDEKAHDARHRPPPEPHGSIDPRTIPKGPLTVVVLAPDQSVIPPADVRVDVGPAPGGRDWHTGPLLRIDEEHQRWHSDDVPVGRVEVRVTGEHVVTRSVLVQVSSEEGPPIEVHVDRAGAIEYAVKIAGGEVPEKVVLALFDEKKKPVAAQFQTRSATWLSTPVLASSATLGPEGIVFGVPPGRYVLRATSPADEYEEATVEVAAGQNAKAEIQVRR